MRVFVLQHVRDIDGEGADAKVVGVYASEEEANNAVAALTTQPGLGEHKDGFSIDAYELGRTHWEDGFVTTSHEPIVDDSEDLADLTARFRALGAPNAQGWARSQIEEGIPQLHRFLFLRQAWKHIVSEGDTNWIDSWIARSKRQPDAPYAGLGVALSAAREKGVSDDQVTDLVRCVQALLLFQLCYLLEDPCIEERDAQDVVWGLFALNDDDTPREPIGGLHESVLETDPTGREMRPRR